MKTIRLGLAVFLTLGSHAFAGQTLVCQTFDRNTKNLLVVTIAFGQGPNGSDLTTLSEPGHQQSFLSNYKDRIVLTRTPNRNLSTVLLDDTYSPKQIAAIELVEPLIRSESTTQGSIKFLNGKNLGLFCKPTAINHPNLITNPTTPKPPHPTPKPCPRC